MEIQLTSPEKWLTTQQITFRSSEVISKPVGESVPDSRILIFTVWERPSYFCKTVLKPTLVYKSESLA